LAGSNAAKVRYSFVISKYFVSKNMTDPKIEEILIHNRRNTDSNSYSSFA
jgi:hypothetical protein